jgi:hypothetical protein
MKRSSLILALTAGFLVLGFGALDARAGFVPLPTTLDQFVNSSGTSNGNFTTVSNPAAGELIQFSSFGYTQATGAPPAASGVHMTPFTLPPPPGETGIQFSGAFNAPAGVTNDWVLTYTVTELTPGAKLTDAYSSITGTNNGGTGGISVSETFTTLTGQPIGTLAVNLANPTATLSLGAGYTSILVTKDIDVIGGSLGSSLSVIDQGYSSSAVPEPASLALLGIGMTGFLAFRRFFKKTSVA